MKYRKFAELESTQLYGIEHKEELGDREVIVCDVQTGGIGRGGSNWISSAASLTISICWRELGVANPALGTLLVVKRVLESYGVRNLLVKWPNDLYLVAETGEVGLGEKMGRGKKIGGVLVNVVTTERGPLSIIGLGVNLANMQPLADLAQFGYQLDKEVLIGQIVEGVELAFQAGHEEVWGCFFPWPYVYFLGQKCTIESIADELVLSGPLGHTFSISSQYSYCPDTNQIYLKSKHPFN
ncbi:BirA family transcriptional regulator, biotin operon repressor / biotin---[acetyl-CoA-carboxylase] ligase [Nematocida homosporus]|uniref:BirA family transcriptional regulator, biotin operon repressor / biotin---[acetyl-CoA-carboxylase] ligase n=1 Tax=Nematocida homosporus TaxID=1912981 RepID=UPI00221E46BC|nr:BirA family transcriptional regulator, biotin operon repressor / biotin---[acetyl-CoA-carboxylase] ligase [Nematocida homosporus]KAI5187396.1 BirA family transcriptional regulator, biotin operon repressor / biotin---[acetyl-CoA-carboxylase] ligase [Nematocida homosporus]